MYEFAVFSHAWLSQGGGNDPNWNPACNLDDTGNSANVIDLADLILFCEDYPQNWLWIACWRTDLLELQKQQAMQMMSSSVSLESVGVTTVTAAASASEPISETHWIATKQGEVDGQAVVQEPLVVDEKSIKEQILDLRDSIKFLEQVWTEESDIQQDIDPKEWQQFMDTVYQNLLDLQIENAKTEQSNGL